MAESTETRRSAPELLAPAGDWQCAKAAVANGADAVYFGLDSGFNARARATSISLDALPDLMAFLHRHGVAGYVTTNILAFSDELPSLEVTIRRIAEAGADAVLVQDLGLVHLIRRTAPDLPIHASTQMSLTSAESINIVHRLGVERVVLARELSVSEIAQIHKDTPMALEVFVHGALCVAYSGQCLTSESLGGRSANRGQCAQACRLPYELICDGSDVDLGEQKYLLSPKDLAAYALVPQLIDAGAMALKIEGRLKTPEYVANITRHYRQAIDSALAGNPVQFTPLDVEEMELSFSRGFSVGWLQGCDHKELVPATSSAKRGVLIGEVERVYQDRVRVKLTRRLKAGDGLVFEGDRAAGQEQGGRVFTLHRRGKRVQGEVSTGVVEVVFHRNSVDLEKLWQGQQVWKSDDPALTRRLRKTFSGEIAGKDLPVEMVVTASVNEPLHVVAKLENGATFACTSGQPLAEAIKHPLTQETLERQLGRLGGSGFRLERLTASIDGTPMIPLSVLGKMRHEVGAWLAQQRLQTTPIHANLAECPVLADMHREIEPAETEPGEPQLLVLCRTMHQLQTAAEHGVSLLYADFQDIRQYREAVELAHQFGAGVYLATPRIQKPGEMGIFSAMMRQQPDGIVVRNLAGLEFFMQRGVPCVADYSLNCANELTLAYLQHLGAHRITASYDMNREQLLEMARNARIDLMEVVVHQHMPMFHMEHCVFCSVLSPGTNKTNCGRPCDRHEVKMRDRVGSEHLLVADVGCRNTLFNGTAQSGAEAVAPLLRLGVRHFRIELLYDEPAGRIQRCIDLYRDLVDGKVSGRDVWTALKAVNRSGVTRGTLEHRRDPLAIL
jgi:putative protease